MKASSRPTAHVWGNIGKALSLPSVHFEFKHQYEILDFQDMWRKSPHAVTLASESLVWSWRPASGSGLHRSSARKGRAHQDDKALVRATRPRDGLRARLVGGSRCANTRQPINCGVFSKL